MSQRLGALLANRLRAGESRASGAPPGEEPGWRDRLMSGIDPSLLHEAGEIEAERWMRDPASGQALALLSFLAWRQAPAELLLVDRRDFRELRFGPRLPTGARGTPPQLDMIAAGEADVVAVVSVGLSYLRVKRSNLPAPYRELADDLDLGPWGMVAERASRGELRFRFLDVVSLVRFAVGLGRNFPGHRAHLLYLFLEPTDAEDYALFVRHRDELETLAGLVRGSSIQFAWSSVGDLWDGWAKLDSPPWLRGLVAELKGRYDVALADLSGLSSAYRRFS